MNNSCTMISVATVILSAAIGSALAQDNGDRSFDQYTCKDVMRESGENRDVAIAFVHGYLLGKANATKYNVEVLEKQSDAFVDYCLNNPNEKALDAMTKVKN
jgi:hypothetical protein